MHLKRKINLDRPIAFSCCLAIAFTIWLTIVTAIFYFIHLIQHYGH